MRRIVCLVLLALASCEKGPAADGYKFERPEYVATEIAVSIRLHPSEISLRRAADQAGAKTAEDGTIMAFSRLHPDRKGCVIEMVDARSIYRPEYLGHELAHCIYGQFHPSQP